MQVCSPRIHHVTDEQLLIEIPPADDVQALTVGAKYIRSLIPAVVNIVYKKLLMYDITARAFTTRSTSYEGPIDEMPDENSPIIKYRKMFLRGYLQKLCSDPSRMEFWEYLDKVGMMVCTPSPPPPLPPAALSLAYTFSAARRNGP